MLAIALLLGGSGSRFGSKLPKQFFRKREEELPLFALTAEKLLTLEPDVMSFTVKEEFLGDPHFTKSFALLQKKYPDVHMVFGAGGSNRHMSFRRAMWQLASEVEGLSTVLVHDANRPFLSDGFLVRIKEAVALTSEEKPAFIPVIPMADSVARIADGRLVAYEKREQLARIQTPQVLHFPTVWNEMQKHLENLEAEWTDEGSFMLANSHNVFYFDGDPGNVKITYAEEAKDL